MRFRSSSFYIAVLFALMLALFVPKSAHAFSGNGDGLDEGTAFVITDCSQLQEIQDDLDAWYRLERNIDCSMTSSWNSGAGFEPIGTSSDPFHGVLRGNNHTITGLTIDRPTTDYVGLFGYMSSSGSVDRLRLKSVSIAGQNCVGGVAGQTVSADVFNIGIYGEVAGTASVGGAVGCNMGLIMNSHSHANITGSPTIAGGLVGYNDSPIYNSFSTGSVPEGSDTEGW